MTSEETKATTFTATKSTKMAKTQDKIATGILTAIVALILIVLVAIIACIVVSGACKLFDIHFLTAKPEQFKAGGGIGPELFNSFYLLILTLLISLPISLGGAIFLTQ